MNNSLNLSVLEVIDYLIEKFNTQIRIKNGKEVVGSSNTKDYKMLKNSLEKFVLDTYWKPLSTFSFGGIDSKFLLDYVDYLEGRAVETGTKGAVPNRLKKLQAVFNHARDMGIKNVDNNIFRCVEEKKKISEATLSIIPYEIIERVKNVDRGKFSSTELFHIDLFLFSFYTGGMSCSDMGYLTSANIKKRIITYEKMRVHRMVEIPLISSSETIISVYHDKCYGDYVLPIFSAKHITEKQQRERIERLSLHANKTLEKVRKEIRYRKKITLSSPLATFVAGMVKANVDPYYIVQNTGCTIDYISKHFL